jgi:membrane protease YdiL (CAAX protease family)
LLLFFFLTFGIATPAFLSVTPNTPDHFSLALLMLGSFAPAFAATLSVRLFGNSREQLAFKMRIRHWRVAPSWFGIAILLPTGIWLIAFAHCVVSGSYEGAEPLALLYFPLILICSFGKEAGLRGFLLPRLLTRTGPISASLLVGLFWSIYHIPLYWREPGYLLLMLVLNLALSIVLTWLFIGSGESVLLTTLTHAVFNTWGQVFLPLSIYVLAIATALIGLWAIFLVMRYGQCLTNLSLVE